jgi:hypothetical protein
MRGPVPQEVVGVLRTAVVDQVDDKVGVLLGQQAFQPLTDMIQLPPDRQDHVAGHALHGKIAGMMPQDPVARFVDRRRAERIGSQFRLRADGHCRR